MIWLWLAISFGAGVMFTILLILILLSYYNCYSESDEIVNSSLGTMSLGTMKEDKEDKKKYPNDYSYCCKSIGN